MKKRIINKVERILAIMTRSQNNLNFPDEIKRIVHESIQFTKHENKQLVFYRRLPIRISNIMRPLRLLEF